MGNRKTSAKPKSSSLSTLKMHDVFTSNLKDAKLVKQVLVEALMQNDMETFQDVLIGHLRTASKSGLSSKTGLGRQTLYDLINEEKEFNPTLNTLAAILKAIAA